MSWVIYLFGSGAIFFVGVGLIALALATFALFQHWLIKILASLIAINGLLLIAASATPLPYWLYSVAGLVSIVWLIVERSARNGLIARRRLMRSLLVAVWVSAVAIEWPYHLLPTIHMRGSPKLSVIGDSVSAGLVAHEKTWTRLLANARNVDVINLSRPGASTSEGPLLADGLPVEGGLVLLEIGGNDLLSNTSAATFEGDLDRLLGKVCSPGREALIFELPLPPLYNEFGRVQRRLAAKHKAALIPKRVFISLLTAEGATWDSVHLTRAGHEQMANVVWQLVAPAYAE